MEKNLRIKGLGIEISNKPFSNSGGIYYKMSYTEAVKLDLIKGNEDGWRLPTIKEWKFLMWLEPLGIISFDEAYYLTSDAPPEYIPEKIRNADLDFQRELSENPYAFQNSGIDEIYIWDSRESEEWISFDGDAYHYILLRNF